MHDTVNVPLCMKQAFVNRIAPFLILKFELLPYKQLMWVFLSFIIVVAATYQQLYILSFEHLNFWDSKMYVAYNIRIMFK